MQGAPRLVRNADAGELIELCLVAAVATVLVIRLVLELSGYPQLGGGGLHIAHVLYGGLLMLVALLLLFSLMNAPVPWLAAFVGGVGSGFFIDEVGKFISSDVNYFYEPAVSVMYVVFMVLFLVLSGVRRWESRITPQDALANALSLLRDGAQGGMAPEARLRAERLLGQADPSDPLVRLLRGHLDSLPVGAARRPSVYVVVRTRPADLYRRLVLRRRFPIVLVALVGLYAASRLSLALALQFDDTGVDGDASNSRGAHFVEVLAGAATALLCAVGLAMLPRSRLVAYRFFLRAVLVSMLVGQVFVFYHDQFAALSGLAVDLLLYAALRYVIGREEAEREAGLEGVPG